MIGPTSETGKTMLASLQAAMGRGMPVDQAITYVKSMAQQGVAPLVDLYAMLKQFERLKQPKVESPQGGNLREQLNGLEAKVMAGQQSMSPLGIPMGRGLGALNAGSMQNPQFAGGGIIAFQEGGRSKSITPELYTKLPMTYEELAQARMAEEAALKAPEGRAEFMRKLDEEAKASGLGQYKESLKMREARADRLAREADLLPEELAALDEEAFWADVAATDQPDFLSALAKAKPKAVERKRSRKEKSSAAKDKADLEKVLRQEAREALNEGDKAKYEEKLKEARDLSKTSVKDYITTQEARETSRLAGERAYKLARIQKGEGTPEYKLQQELAETPRYLPNGEPNPEYGDLAQRLADLRVGRRGAGSRVDIKFLQDQYRAAEKALNEAIEAHNIYGTEESLATLNAARARRDKALKEYEQKSLGSDFAFPPAGASGVPTTGAKDLSQMTDDELMAEINRG